MELPYKEITREMDKRNRLRKTVNILLCLAIVILGVTSTIYKVRYEGGFLTCFREMTVCSTVLTTITSAALILHNLYELRIGSETSIPAVYYFRLSSAVTEFIVLMIVLLGYLPYFTDHPVITRYDMLNMHVLIPILTIGTFLFNDSAIGEVSPRMLWNGLDIIAIYAVFILTLILTYVVPENRIPYSFLDVRNQPFWFPLVTALFICGIGYLLSWLFYKLNRKLSWLWFKDVM